jgi:hypothetical protein
VCLYTVVSDLPAALVCDDLAGLDGQAFIVGEFLDCSNVNHCVLPLSLCVFIITHKDLFVKLFYYFFLSFYKDLYKLTMASLYRTSIYYNSIASATRIPHGVFFGYFVPSTAKAFTCYIIVVLVSCVSY